MIAEIAAQASSTTMINEHTDVLLLCTQGIVTVFSIWSQGGGEHTDGDVANWEFAGQRWKLNLADWM